MSSKGDHPTKGQSSVPPKVATGTRPDAAVQAHGQHIEAIYQTRPPAGASGCYHTKVADVAKETGLPRHNETKASGRGSSARTATGEAPSTKGTNYYAESDSASSSGGIAQYLYPNLDESERKDLEDVTVPANEGRFGRSIKQAAVRDQKRKDRDFEERLKQQRDVLRGEKAREGGDTPARSKDHLADLQGHKRTM
ncbi:uncharacterized protein UTRI_03855_B [Ustilago trichophora]|uniref:Uncharacterized protein n=1 Tax=Ustilago trichophora TaxID=86804 RepID=A0A5C3E2A4_9BASI|nr:uncharacterized protein UTRI_03855_B [Ustilago trichophora]